MHDKSMQSLGLLRRIRTLAALPAVLCAFALPLATAQAEAIDTILQTKVIRVAASPDFPPYGLMNKDQKILGYDTDVAELIARKLGVRLVQVPAVAPTRIPFLTTDKVDVVIGSLSITEERKQAIDFSIPYGSFTFGIYGPKKIAVSRAEDLAGKTIAVQRGTPSEVTLDKMAPPGTKIVRFDDTNILATAFMSGQADLMAVGANVPEMIGEKSPAAKPEMKIVFPGLPIGIGVRKGEERTVKRMNELVMELRQSGELDALSKKWFGVPLAPL
ncbi:transporter substrate-binding domain-containing protein [Reyranella sp.]|uniref:transporter substrate-binding domain-containing protein n=1 Tax=Reyranella sp. TaxID=1929291 RepID=UPI003D107C48